MNKRIHKISGIRACLALMLLLFLFAFWYSAFETMPGVICMFSIFTFLLCIKAIKSSGTEAFGWSGVILLYLFMSQFCLCIVQELYGREQIQYSLKVLSFLDSDNLVNALFLANVAMISYSLAVSKRYKMVSVKIAEKKIWSAGEGNEEVESNIIYIIGMLFLIFSFLVMVYLFFSGQISLSMDYSDYREVVFDNFFYQYMIMFFSFGVCFVCAVVNKNNMKVSILLIGIIAILFLLTGNRGEVLYPALAAYATLNVRKKKIKPIYILGAVVALILVVPFISSARHGGGWQNMILNYSKNLSESVVETFAEIGIQLRLTVYVMDELVMGTRNYLYGYSYYEFLIRWIKEIFSLKDSIWPIPTDFNFKTAYATMGFSQVAESYANFGLIGVMVFHFILGAFIGRREQKKASPVNLAITSACCSVFINMTRNKFAFVPTQLIYIFLLYLLIKILSGRKIKFGIHL